jgi:hypothetical protein
VDKKKINNPQILEEKLINNKKDIIKTNKNIKNQENFGSLIKKINTLFTGSTSIKEEIS